MHGLTRANECSGADAPQRVCNPEIARRSQLEETEVRAELRRPGPGSPPASGVSVKARPGAPVKPQSGGATAVLSFLETTVLIPAKSLKCFIQLRCTSAAAAHTFESRNPLKIKPAMKNPALIAPSSVRLQPSYSII